MSIAKPLTAILLCYALASPGFAQTAEITERDRRPMVSWFTWNYEAHPVPKISWEDSARIERLMRAGNLYLSLRDAIALALENNLDIENARLTPRLSDANILRASAGRLLRTVSSNISSGQSSASLGVLGAANAVGNASGVSSSSNSNILSGLSVQLAGSEIPNLDPTLYLSSQFAHTTQPQSSLLAGTNYLVSSYKSAIFGVQQGFLTGTTVQLGMNNTLGYKQNTPNNMFNPSTTAGLQLYLSQNLLQGFRPSVNNRNIRVAKNQRHMSDLTFRRQVMATVTNVVNLYWDLVSFSESLKVKQRTLELDTKLYSDNKRRAELGAIAPIDIIQAEAEMKSAQQAVTTAETQVLQQEMILKSVLTRGGLNNQQIVSARIIPTDHFDVPPQEAVRPVQDLIAEAFANRPDVEESAVGLENTRITTLGVKDALKPTLTAFVNLQNNGLAGQVNSLPAPIYGSDGTLLGYKTRTEADVNQYFLGGYGTVLSQLFGRNFPNYSAGFTLNVPIRNRSARADLITDQLTYRQQQIQDRQLQNAIKLDVLNAYTALMQARAAYDTSVEARRLQEQTFNGTRRKYELGTATILDVVITQRDMTTRELAEVDARNQYIRARTSIDQLLGRTLKSNDVDIEQAKTGVVGREPDPIPAVPPAPVAAPNPTR